MPHLRLLPHIRMGNQGRYRNKEHSLYLLTCNHPEWDR